MKKIFNLFLIATLFLTNVLAFGQTEPSDTTGGGNPSLEGTPDAQPASIDATLIYLAVIGLLFAIYTIQKNLKKA